VAQKSRPSNFERDFHRWATVKNACTLSRRFSIKSIVGPNSTACGPHIFDDGDIRQRDG